MKLLRLGLLILLCIAVSWATVEVLQRRGAASSHESSYDRVIRTGVLRCG